MIPKLKPILATILMVQTGSAAISAPTSCASMSDDSARLACYDAIYKTPNASTDDASTAPTQWEKTVDSSALTDEKSVFLRIESTETIPGRFGGYTRPATLFLRCQENTTSAIFSFNDQHMADFQSYGIVEYRVDNQPLQKVRTNESTNNKSLGLWSGGRSIPFIKQLIGHDKLVVRATPYGESPITVTYPISGLDQVLPELRETCHW